MTTEPARDLGDVPDFGDGTPAGCKGKIDFLFVISREGNMLYRQEQLTTAFPVFIETIQSKFEDFDYHIMVVDGDDWWGSTLCTSMCPTPTCTVGQDCCPWFHPNYVGEPCCDDPDYPCQDLGLVTECDNTWGAGTVFPAGKATADKPCPIDGGRRYLVKGQTELTKTFECIATIGKSGTDMLGQALTAAVQKPINEPGGCNAGFLREDALLMVTTIATHVDEIELGSEGSPKLWAKAVIDAKSGDDEAVVMFNIGGGDECVPGDRICEMAAMFPYHHSLSVLDPDYGSGFIEAVGLVETACAGFSPPG